MSKVNYKFLSRKPRGKELKFILKSKRFISEKEIEIKIEVFPVHKDDKPFSGEVRYEILTRNFYEFESLTNVISNKFNGKTNKFQDLLKSRVLIKDGIEEIPDLPLTIFVSVVDEDGLVWPNSGNIGYYSWEPVLPLQILKGTIKSLNSLKLIQ